MDKGIGDTVKIVSETLKKGKPEKVTVQEYIWREQALSDISLREKMINFLFQMYRFLVFSTVGIIILQGFNLWGFNLDPDFLRWLGGATIGEIGILAGVAYRALFRKGE